MSFSSPPRALLDYSPYSHPASPAPDDDENASLRSQALNADGTPKRPMNAFMIFARRRRPQVSAANQMMRTGEISKILSKEWNTMPMSDKQFYLDQAKKLKENFNTKYPDYVYRRRPNNSRKKRRADAAVRGAEAYGPRDDSLSPHAHSPPAYHPHHHHHHSTSLSPVDALVPADAPVPLAPQSYRVPYLPHLYHHQDAPAAPASYHPYYSHSRHAHPHAHAHPHYDALPAALSFPPTHSPGIYNPDDDAALLGGAGGSGSGSSGAAFPRLEPVKLEHAWGAGLGGARRPPAAPRRHWPDAPAPAFPTLGAPFYPSSGTVSPSTASSSSAASYFGAAGADEPAPPSASAHHPALALPLPHPPHHGSTPAAAAHHGHSSSPAAAHHSPAGAHHAHSSPAPYPALHLPRAYSGATLGSTLALSPAAVPGPWSSVRTGAAKAEL